jgi:N-acetylglucosaminyldiphosphoundecaprenol N-acetyl-beta-D-mannosaminyltransferase
MQKNKLSTVSIIGTSISSITMEELIEYMNSKIDSKSKIRICVTPVNCLTAAHHSKDLRSIYNTADIVLCDGVPILWASKYLNNPIKQRITGLDLTPQYIKECVDKGFSMYFLGAKEGVAKHLAEKMQQTYSAIKIVGYYSPPFAEKFSDRENAKMISLINDAKPDIVFVSFTAPKQDYWIYDHIDKLDTHIAIGVGGAFEVSAGLIERAPVFYQKNGLEWFYRFIKEPRRLFKRYFIDAPIFFPLVLIQKLWPNYFDKKL